MIDCILKQHQDRAQSIQPSVMYTVSIHHVCHGIGTMSVTGVAFVEHEKSMVTITQLFYHSITTDVNCYQTCCDWQFLSFNRTVHWCCMEHSPTAGGKTLNFTLLITSLPQQQRWTPLIIRFRESYIRMNICCESTRLKKSSSGWLKSCKVEHSIIVKRCDFRVCSFAR